MKLLAGSESILMKIQTGRDVFLYLLCWKTSLSKHFIRIVGESHRVVVIKGKNTPAQPLDV